MPVAGTRTLIVRETDHRRHLAYNSGRVNPVSSVDVHLPTKESMRNSGTSELRSPTTSSDFLEIGGSFYVAEVNHTDIGQVCAGAIGPPQITATSW
jgi:hypothetical protein